MKRVLTAFVLIAVVVALLVFGKLWMVTLFAAGVALLAALEFRTIAAACSSAIPGWWTVGAVALLFVVVFLLPRDTLMALSLRRWCCWAGTLCDRRWNGC